MSVLPDTESHPGLRLMQATAAALDAIASEFRNQFDHVHGGFGRAPKFPRPSELLFLLREYARAGNKDARDMVSVTLRAMALGGMRDHIGGGFHRYSVDEQWRVPHFEKMLYDQAQLVIALLEASQAAGDPFYADVAEDTLQYVLREMTDESGGFYSAEDADSIPPEQVGEPHPHATEGAFYLWTAHELDNLLGGDAAIVKARFGIEQNGNAPADPQQEFVGKNLLYVGQSVEQIARATGKSPDEVQQVLARARLTMFEARVTRPRPHLDDKVLTAWNGLMIAAFARASRVVANGAPYLQAAQRAAAFLHDRMWNADTRTLLRRYRKGEASIEAYAEDYAYLIYGLLELFQADTDVRWLDWAERLQRRQDELFWDAAEGGWFSTTGKDTTVLLRLKEDYDGAEPAASSIGVLNLMTLAHLTGDEALAPRIELTLRMFAGRAAHSGRTVPMALAALSTFHAGSSQVVLPSANDAFRAVLGRRYLPNAIVIPLRAGIEHLLPWTTSMKRDAAYVCRDFSCLEPATTPEDFARRLELEP